MIKYIQKTIITIALLLGFTTQTNAQELNCKVQINSEMIQGTAKEVFKELESNLVEFLNNRKWTDAQMGALERIECSFVFTIKEFTDDEKYKCELQIMAKRPVYNSIYTTTLLNHRDMDVSFVHRRMEPLQFNANSYESNLTGILAFYINMILALDFDSFGLYGGDPFYKSAQDIANIAQSSGAAGWQSFDNNRSRYNLISTFMEASQKPYRSLLYNYHRQGLDIMSNSLDKGRATIAQSLNVLTQIQEARPTSILLTLFADTKIDELNELFGKQAPSEERTQVGKILQRLYPAQKNRYSAIIEN